LAAHFTAATNSRRTRVTNSNLVPRACVSRFILLLDRGYGQEKTAW
jgi:hypothetical protein